ncbi:MAG TPA: hypothetical protein VHQ45_13270 [Gemmatimonadaceae bacterium]|nr:hypothetical protein [Gemmatimonadaceae bacterium]
MPNATPNATPSLARLARAGVGAFAVGVLALSACAMRPSGDERADAAAALHAGRYDEAIARYTRLAAAPDAATADRLALLRALADVGRYDDAIRHAEQWTAAPGGAAFHTTLGVLRRERGDLAGAERAFEQALAARAPDSLAARVQLAVLAMDRGARDEAMRSFASTLDDALGSGGAPRTSSDLTALGTAARYLGRTEPQRFRDALRLYDLAIAADTLDPEPRLRLAELFLEKFNSPEAQQTLAPLLAANPRHAEALWLAARRLHFDGQPGAPAQARQALQTNARFAPAHVLLARSSLDAEAYAEAAAQAEQALAVDSTRLDALATLAAARWLAGDSAGFDAVRRRALARNPQGAELYAVLAAQSARNRLYADAVRFAAEGVRLDSTSWSTAALLGVNQLRVGQMAAGRQALERAFAGDPYDVWTKNTLDLLDATAKYEETRTPRFVFVTDPKETGLLAPYLATLAEEAYDSLARRYDYRPPTPVRLELYPRHADFSVRTVGLAGFDAVGVSFGSVLAMDSPAARDRGAFNWGSTFWHELAHAFTLGASGHRVPRWLSEGISVREERRARPGWGADATPEFLTAYAQNRLLPVSRLNDGFVRPAYPEQILFSYYQASLVVELMEREWGEAAVPALVRAYGDRLTTPQAVERVLRTTPADLDRRFDAYMRERFGRQLAAVREGPPEGDDAGAAAAPQEGNYYAQLARGRALYAARQPAQAVPYLERAKALLPEAVGPESPGWYLARIRRDQGDLQGAARELAALTARDEDFYDAYLAHAEVQLQLGDSTGAARALEQTIWISPYDAALHERLAALAAATGDRRTAVRERAAVVALGPVDRAEALYQLARAQYEAGDRAAARRTVLQALEDAPNFDKAQELLLALQGSGAGGR